MTLPFGIMSGLGKQRAPGLVRKKLFFSLWPYLTFALNNVAMKKGFYVFLLIAGISFMLPHKVHAQCAICTKTAQQMGDRPAKALNGGILYLAAMPFIIFSYIGYRWWKSNHEA
jgi:hypothetical protein